MDVAIWAGLVPENAHDPALLQGLLDHGALGFKSFMSPAGALHSAHAAAETAAAAAVPAAHTDVETLAGVAAHTAAETVAAAAAEPLAVETSAAAAAASHCC